MVDVVSAEKRSEMMAGIRARNTKPEILVRQLLHRAGFRFVLHRKDLPGKPDIVLPKWQTVIFVHGCFWHGHENCPIFRLPKTRTAFWANKILENQRRDQDVVLAYKKSSWNIIEVWECAMKGKQKLPDTELTLEIVTAVKSRSRYSVIRGS